MRSSLFLSAAWAATFYNSGVTAQAQVATYIPQGSNANGISYSVNVPSATAQSGSGPIYIQMVAPSGTQWLGLGQGGGMTGSNMFVLYASGNGNVTVSPRLGQGNFEPGVNNNARITILAGTGISSAGVMTANFRCDSCLSWTGGSMSPTNGNSNWIWARKGGNALNSATISTNIQQHDAYGTFTLNLPAGTSSDTGNPFLQTATQSGGSTQATSGSSSGSSVSAFSTSNVRRAHGITMAVVFLFLFPLGALLIYLPFSRKVLIHAPWQSLSVCLLIAGSALGITLGLRIDEYDGYHQIIGYVVLACLLLFQPALGLIHHLRYRKDGQRTVFGHIHRWHGRGLVLLGMVNGGLGLYVSGPIGSQNVPRWAVIAYGVVAGLMGVFYVGFLSGIALSRKRKTGSKEENKYRAANVEGNGAGRPRA